MAISPDEAGRAFREPALPYDEILRSLETTIDRELRRNPPGKAFELTLPKDDFFGVVLQRLVERYRSVGWAGARVEQEDAAHYRLILDAAPDSTD